MECKIEQLYKYLNYDFQHLLRTTMIIDSYQYFLSCFHKLESASLSLEALNNIFNSKLEKIDTELKERDLKLKTEGQYSYKLKEDTLDYFGVPLERAYVYNKLYSEIYSSLHSYFDIFAQFINSAFFADNCIAPKKVSLKNVYSEFNKFPEYQDFFNESISTLLDNPFFQYIEDINNISKHRYQIFSISSENLITGEYKLSIPNFRKDGREYTQKNLLEHTIDILNFCINLLLQTLEYLNSYLHENNHKQIASRLYNVSSNLQFNSKENFSSFKPDAFEIYINIDSKPYLNYYRILFSKEDINSKSIENFNCPYKSIILYDINNNFIGVLNLDEKEEDLDLKDIPIKFKKYKFTETNDHSKLYEHAFDISKAHYPLLTNSKYTVLD